MAYWKWNCFVPASSDGEGWYCQCANDYTGALCERKLCDQNPCQHGGSCVLLEGQGRYVCLCPYGRQGVNCSEGKTSRQKSINIYQYNIYIDQYFTTNIIMLCRINFWQNSFSLNSKLWTLIFVNIWPCTTIQNIHKNFLGFRTTIKISKVKVLEYVMTWLLQYCAIIVMSLFSHQMTYI